MPIKKITEPLSISDTLLLEINTPDANGCYLSNPYQVKNVTIYFIEKDFLNGNLNVYEDIVYDSNKIKKAENAEKIACASPTEENLELSKKLRAEANATGVSSVYYYKEAVPVKILGNPDYPAWLSTDVDNAFIENIPLDEDGNTQYGRFKFEWNLSRERDGDYFVCWTWMPNIAGDTLSASKSFYIRGDTAVTTSIPSHRTKTDKHYKLLTKYLPEMFKLSLSSGDLTSDVLDKINLSVGDAFDGIEDQMNQIIDLLDANVLQEDLLPLLSNLFGIKLRYDDPTMWRRQTRTAIPLLKEKGTYQSLVKGLDQAGIKLNNYTRLWQTFSPYTFQESFIATGSELDVELFTRFNLPVNSDNYELYIRYTNTDIYDQLTPVEDYVNFYQTPNVEYRMEWIGETASIPITLQNGDIVRILYQYAPTVDQDSENYIRNLPLADTRDETIQEFPPKNWNIRLVSEDDPLFPLLQNHPYVPPLIFGKIRTEFPFSENIYNMDEYNGSKRDTTNPCDINKDFSDLCNNCASSKFNIDLEIENLSDDRIHEAKDIIKDYVPFHAILHNLNLSSSFEDFVESPIEEVEMLINMRLSENIISGNGPMLFNRTMVDGLTSGAITRNMLAEKSDAIDAGTAIGYNNNIVLYSPVVNFNKLGINLSNNELEILSPSIYAGVYSISSPEYSYADIIGSIPEPLNSNSFTFILSNILYDNNISIYQDNIYGFYDSNIVYSDYNIKGDWDVNNDPSYSGGAWKLDIDGYGVYTIQDILPDGTLLINNGSPDLGNVNISGLDYSLLDDLDNIQVSSNGNLTVTTRGRVEVNDINLEIVQSIFKKGDFLVDYSSYPYDEWEIVEFSENPAHFYVLNYSDGDAVGIPRQVRRKLVKNSVGYLKYEGIKLQTATNYETFLPIINGVNPPVTGDNWLEDNILKENYLIYISYIHSSETISNYYSIMDIDGTTITLGGPMADWQTISAGGTNVSFTIYRYDKNTITIAGHEFSIIDRRGNDTINLIEENIVPISMLSMMQPNDVVSDVVYQKEHITINIDWRKV